MARRLDWSYKKQSGKGSKGVLERRGQLLDGSEELIGRYCNRNKVELERPECKKSPKGNAFGVAWKGLKPPKMMGSSRK